MSEMITLSAKTRTADFGSAGSRRLLRAGYIPAVIYGKQAPAHCAVVAKEFLMKKHHFTGSTIITLDVEGQKHMVFVKTFQENLLKGIVNHIDFYEVTAGEKVRTHVGIELVGNPVGVRNGGVLEQVLHEIDVVVADGVKIHTPEDETVATVKAVKVEEAAPADAEAADATAASATDTSAETK